MYLRLVITLIIVTVLTAAGWKFYTLGERHVQRQWDAQKAKDAEIVRTVEISNLRRGEISSSNAAKEQADRARATVAVSVATLSLRDALRSKQVANESAEAAIKRAAALGELLRDCSERYTALAGRAQSHVIDLRRFNDAWPICTPVQ